MMFMCAALGFAIGLAAGYPLAQVSVTLSGLVAALSCVVGLEVGSRLAGRHVDPKTWALKRPSPTAYQNVAGIITTVFPVAVFVGQMNGYSLYGQANAPEFGLMVYLALRGGPLGLLVAPILVLGAIGLLGGLLGGTVGKLMRRGQLKRDAALEP